MESPPPPWRVFDAPADSAAATGGAAPPAMPALPITPTVALGLLAALAGLVIAGILAFGAPHGDVSIDGVGNALPGASGASSTAGSGDVVVVDVAGAVLRPGVYRVATGSRVGDAIAAAGGYGPRVDAERAQRELNLAALVADGDHIVVPSRDDGAATASGGSGAGSGGSGGSAGSVGRIDLNRGSEAELESLPGIGPATAAKIIASRTATPFRSVDELLERKLVGQKTFDAIKALVTVG
jgi:competence protein ComEA